MFRHAKRIEMEAQQRGDGMGCCSWQACYLGMSCRWRARSACGRTARGVCERVAKAVRLSQGDSRRWAAAQWVRRVCLLPLRSTLVAVDGSALFFRR